MDNFLSATALLFTVRPTVRAAEQKVDTIKIGSLVQDQLLEPLLLRAD